MTFTVRIRGANAQPMICVYTCIEHGEFDAEVMRDEQGNSPDFAPCPVPLNVIIDGVRARCEMPSPWTPTPVFGKVKSWEVVRGNWERPERKTFTDTRDLGEGMSYDEWKKKRAKVWEERRQQEVRELLR
jgi:hypothetical protein